MTNQKDIFRNNISHKAIIVDLRSRLSDSLNDQLSDFDCVRFLRAQSGSVTKTVPFIENWSKWRSTLLPSISEDGLQFSPNTILYSTNSIENHPYAHLLPVAHHGFDVDGRPIYWERTGTIQSTFKQVQQRFSLEVMLQYHIMSQEAFEVRYQFASSKFKKDIHDCVVVFDMKNVAAVLDWQSIEYVKRTIRIDQEYYPETLHKLFIINAPWYFSALYALFKPFVDPRTAAKVVICGSAYLPKLQQHISLSDIPTELGGECVNFPWAGPFLESSGCASAQIKSFVQHRFPLPTTDTDSSDLRHQKDWPSYLTQPERDSLEALRHIRMQNQQEEQYEDQSLVAKPHNSSNAPPSTSLTPHSKRLIRNSAVSTRSSAFMGSDASDFSQSVALSTSSPSRNYSLSRSQDWEIHSLAMAIVALQKEKSYHNYVIQVSHQSLVWMTRKRYSEFVALRKRFKKHAPHVSRPRLPQKHIFRQKSQPILAKRVSALNLFLQQLLENCNECCGKVECQLLLSFLGGTAQSTVQTAPHNVQNADSILQSVEDDPHERLISNTLSPTSSTANTTVGSMGSALSNDLIIANCTGATAVDDDEHSQPGPSTSAIIHRIIMLTSIFLLAAVTTLPCWSLISTIQNTVLADIVE